MRLELDSFIQAVASGSRPIVSGEDGEAALNLATRVLEAIGQFTQRHQGGSASEIPWDSENVYKGSARVCPHEKSDMPRILIVTGEASGDLHGAHLVKALKQLSPSLQVVGIGGSLDAGGRRGTGARIFRNSM